VLDAPTGLTGVVPVAHDASGPVGDQGTGPLDHPQRVVSRSVYFNTLLWDTLQLCAFQNGSASSLIQPMPALASAITEDLHGG